MAMLALLSHVTIAGERVDFSPRDRAQLQSIADGIGRASTFTLHEGLPHPMWEAEAHKKELATKEIVRFHGSSFYQRPLAVAAVEVEELRRLVSAPDSYRPYSGEKRCGGFHPDYALTWQDGTDAYRLLICFGCHEMKLYGPKVGLTLDIRGDAFRAFESTLKKHRQQRPERS